LRQNYVEIKNFLSLIPYQSSRCWFLAFTALIVLSPIGSTPSADTFTERTGVEVKNKDRKENVSKKKALKILNLSRREFTEINVYGSPPLT
ncbi:MAG TPA: hypothetical protein VHT73_03805, partial [Thermodesulfobacteriota bacterium]|nr:hypothetical protein [Thermodesulfobacteriota bacterium]